MSLKSSKKFELSPPKVTLAENWLKSTGSPLFILSNGLLTKLEEVEKAYGKISGKKGLSEETVKHIDEAVFLLRQKIVNNSI